MHFSLPLRLSTSSSLFSRKPIRFNLFLNLEQHCKERLDTNYSDCFYYYGGSGSRAESFALGVCVCVCDGAYLSKQVAHLLNVCLGFFSRCRFSFTHFHLWIETGMIRWWRRVLWKCLRRFLNSHPRSAHDDAIYLHFFFFVFLSPGFSREKSARSRCLRKKSTRKEAENLNSTRF